MEVLYIEGWFIEKYWEIKYNFELLNWSNQTRLGYYIKKLYIDGCRLVDNNDIQKLSMFNPK